MFDMRIDSGISVWVGLGFGSSEAVEADRIRSELWAREAEIARLRAEQVELLRGADRLQLDTADGSRSMTDWVVAELDVSP
jgi:hypothetical protein